MSGLECPSTVFQRCGKIASIQMKKLHGEIRKEAFRGQLDRSLDPVFGAIEIAEIQEKPAEKSDARGFPGSTDTLFRSHRTASSSCPFGGPIMEPYPIITVRKIWIDLDRLAIPRQALVKPTHVGVMVTDVYENDWRAGIQLSRLLVQFERLVTSPQRSTQQPSPYQWYAVT